MIKGTFRIANTIIEVVVKENELIFYDTSSQMMTPITGLKFNRLGVIKEFPDLENDEDWKNKAIERLKEHLKTMKTEQQRLIYVRDELKKYGYQPLFQQRAGFRTLKL